ncbi:hypothetical protein LX82_03566 [Celeribacter halophilus]|uniref:Uncharacterized protein n=1 Tax=Celeribacter halophilus TaxID=576117 RepID=A0A1I3R2H4_9RHOB|nr:hypothetical protein LX82_03566 [Celeribacter halophilus]SFJ40548.1 hypothetical protein SAMN04488138_104243 [Celeribacter halophilus]
MRLWIGSILSTIAERSARPAIPDLFLVGEAATLGHMDMLLTAASLLRGYPWLGSGLASTGMPRWDWNAGEMALAVS